MSLSRRWQRVDWWLLLVAAVVGAGLVAGYVNALVSAGSTNGHRFGALVDDHGRVFSDQPSSRGFKLVAFGFTECPEICPTTLVRVHRVLDELGSTGVRLTSLFVTLDPDRDTPQVLGRYTAAFDPRIVGLTGGAREIRAFASTYGVYPPGEQPAGMGEAIDHSAKLYLLGHDNELLASYQPTASPQSIASDVRHAIEIARAN